MLSLPRCVFFGCLELCDYFNIYFTSFRLTMSNKFRTSTDFIPLLKMHKDTESYKLHIK